MNTETMTLNTNKRYVIQSYDNNTIIIEYLYYYLKNNEHKLQGIASLSNQYSLNKNQILCLDIPLIDIYSQKEIVNYCELFYNNINKYINENELLKSKDIFSIIMKIYNLS